MLLFYLSIVIAVLSSMLYHIVLKLTPSDVNPAISLIATYATAAVLCVPLLFLFPLKTSIANAFRQLNWTSYALALALVGLEVGFLLAYRAGWNISAAAIVVNATATTLLIPVGLSLFKEKPSLVNIIGILVCIVGLVMVNIKR